MDKKGGTPGTKSTKMWNREEKMMRAIIQIYGVTVSQITTMTIYHPHSSGTSEEIDKIQIKMNIQMAAEP